MSFLDPDRFHRAARDGHLDLLQEANRKELNSRDEDGMTPAMWAAYYGHLDALRLIIGRGGDPDKCDFYGNTSLHCAAGNGHTDCVSFLVHFGVNLWALDNDLRTAKDVAAMNQREAALRLLDQAQSKHALINRKLVQRLKEKSVYDAEKRIKQYRKMQVKAAKKAEKEEKQKTQKDARILLAPKFSDIVGVADRKESGILSKQPSTLGRKKIVAFKTEDAGAGFRGGAAPKRSAKGSDDGASTPSRSPSDTHSSDDANSDVLQAADSGIGEDLLDSGGCSIFERPGFGTVAFRSPALRLPLPPEEAGRNALNALKDWPRRVLDDSIGSAGSLARRHITWEDECGYDDADDDATDEEEASDDDDYDRGELLSLFLTTLGLADYVPLFQSEQIDLESLTLLSEEDLKNLGMPLGPRRKLGNAIQQRLRILREPGAVKDSCL